MESADTPHSNAADFRMAGDSAETSPRMVDDCVTMGYPQRAQRIDEREGRQHGGFLVPAQITEPFGIRLWWWLKIADKSSMCTRFRGRPGRPSERFTMFARDWGSVGVQPGPAGDV